MKTLRGFIEYLRKKDKTIELKQPLSKNLEMAGVFKSLENRQKPIIAKDKDSGSTVVCNVFGTKELVADALECEQKELVLTMKDAIERPTKPETVEKRNAPVLDVGEEPDMLNLPIPLHVMPSKVEGEESLLTPQELFLIGHEIERKLEYDFHPLTAPLVVEFSFNSRGKISTHDIIY